MSNRGTRRDWELWNDRTVVEGLEDYWKGKVFDAHREHVRSALETIRKADPEARTLLDFGCGTGRYVQLSEELGFEYTGVDITEEMLSKARSKYPRTTFEVDDIFHSNRPDGSYDVVLSADVIVHLPDFGAPFATLYRLARRWVVVKLCYLTKRDGIRGACLRDPGSFVRRNDRGFIEHFFNVEEILGHIRAVHSPGWMAAEVFPSNQEISKFQAVIVVGKHGAPRVEERTLKGKWVVGYR